MRRPEHEHYVAIEEHLQKCIKEGSDFLFHTKLFEEELRRLWETYDVPYQVHARRWSLRGGVYETPPSNFNRSSI